MTLEIFICFLNKIVESGENKINIQEIGKFIDQLIIDTHTCMHEIKTTITSELIFSFTKDLAECLAKFPQKLISAEAANILKASSGSEEVKPKHTQIKASLFLEKNPSLEQRGRIIQSAFRKSNNFRSAFNKQTKPTATDYIRSAFKTVSRDPKFEEKAEAEFEEFIKEGRLADSKVNGFLEGIVSYLQPEKGIDREIIKIGLKIFNSYLNNYGESNKHFEIKAKQTFLIKIGLDRLLCKMIIFQANSHIIFDCLETANKLLAETNPAVQAAFKATISELGSHDFFRNIHRQLQELLASVEALMTEKNSKCLRNQLFSELFFEDKKFRRAEASIERVCTIYRFLQLLCEGHNLSLQNFLRNQSESGSDLAPSRNVDFIEDAIENFKSFTKYCNGASIKIGIHLLQFLIEAVLGPCRENQKAIINYKIIDSCKDLLNEIGTDHPDLLRAKGFFESNPDSMRPVNQLFKCVVDLLQSLLEGNFDLELMREMGAKIEFASVMGRVKDIYNDFFTRELRITPKQLSNIGPDQLVFRLNSKVFSREIQEALQIFLFIRQVDEATECYEPKIARLQGLARDAYSFMHSHTATIELVFQGNVTKVYFMKHPACYYLPEAAKEEVMNAVRRGNPNEKIADFMSNSLTLFNQMDFTQSLKKKLKIDPVYIPRFRMLSLAVCYLLNLYLLSFSEFRVVSSEAQDDDRAHSKTLVFALVILNIIVTSVVLLLHSITKQKIERLNKWSEYFFNIKNIKTVTPADKEWLQVVLAKDISEYSLKDYIRLIRFKRLKEGHRTPVPLLIKLANDIKFVDTQTYSLMFYIVCYVSGLWTGDHWFYSFPLLDTLSQSETLKILITAVTYNGLQILLAVALVVIIIFIFSVYAYYFVLDTFWNDAFETGENQCTSVRHCFFTIFSLVASPHPGPSVVRLDRRRDRAAVVPPRQQGQVLLAVLLRPRRLHHRQRHGHEHHLRHHHPDLRPDARHAQRKEQQHAQRLLRLLRRPQRARQNHRRLRLPHTDRPQHLELPLLPLLPAQEAPGRLQRGRARRLSPHLQRRHLLVPVRPRAQAHECGRRPGVALDSMRAGL